MDNNAIKAKELSIFTYSPQREIFYTLISLWWYYAIKYYIALVKEKSYF